MGLPKFKMGITFSGKYRGRYVEPTCKELLKLGYSPNDIFYDKWHEALINGTQGDNVLKTIYNQQCELVIVLLSPDYKERNWCGNIEWPSIKELINVGEGDKLCLLGVDAVDINKIDGLYEHQAIVKRIDGLLPVEIARFIKQVYERKYHSEDSSYDAGDLKIDEVYGKPGQIAAVMGGLAIRPEWKTYFEDLIMKMTYYMENYSDVEISGDEAIAIAAYHRAEIMIRFITEMSEDREYAKRILIEVWDSYISERKRGTRVLSLDYQNDFTIIWEYIPGDWDDRIFSWK